MTEAPLLRVLAVVDDDGDFRRLIEITLTGESRLELGGVAARAEQALPLAREMQPDLIILDHFIEGRIMGVQLAPLLKRESPDSLILLFTTHDLAVEVSREPAIDRYLRKYDLDKLLPTVKEMLGIS